MEMTIETQEVNLEPKAVRIFLRTATSIIPIFKVFIILTSQLFNNYFGISFDVRG